MDWPLVSPVNSRVVTVASPQSLGPSMLGWAWTGAPADTLYPTANLAIFVPFVLYEPAVITKMFCANGTVASGNIDMGIYDVTGTRIVNKGSTAMAGTDTRQVLDITDTELGRGAFYMAFACDNDTAKFYRWPAGGGGATGTGVYPVLTPGAWQMATAFALPATATFAALTTNYVPAFGFELDTVL